MNLVHRLRGQRRSSCFSSASSSRGEATCSVRAACSSTSRPRLRKARTCRPSQPGRRSASLRCTCSTSRFVGTRTSVRATEPRGVPRVGEAEKLGVLGTDASDLISAIDHNLTHPPDEALFQRKVAYDNLVGECLPDLRSRARRRSQSLLEALDRVMSRHDRDANPDAVGTGRHRAVLGIYYYEEPMDEDD